VHCFLFKSYIGRAHPSTVSHTGWALEAYIGQNGAQNVKELRRLKKVRFFCRHRTSDQEGRQVKTYTVEGFGEKSARETFFDFRRPGSPEIKHPHQISVADYYEQQYNIRLRFPGLPVVKTLKNEFFPMELCFVSESQRYPFKLDEIQTKDMIKYTVEPPNARSNIIKANVGLLNWSGDPMLNRYGLAISTEMIRTNSRLLPTPKIHFGPGSINKIITPRNGRWDLCGKKLYDWGPLQQKVGYGLKSWGIMIFESERKVRLHEVQHFLRELMTSVIKHGGQVVEKVS
jgi:eukaryotic translation initiation factor 2C